MPSRVRVQQYRRSVCGVLQLCASCVRGWHLTLRRNSLTNAPRDPQMRLRGCVLPKVAVDASVSTHTSTVSLGPSSACHVLATQRFGPPFFARITAVPRVPVVSPNRASRRASGHLLSQPGAKAERVVGSYDDAADSQSGMCGAQTPAPRVTSSRPAARPMARPRDGAGRQKRRHPSASTQGQLGLGRGPPISGRRRRRESAGPREGESRGPARLVQRAQGSK